MTPAIRVESLSKVYRVHHESGRKRGYRTFREDVVDVLRKRAAGIANMLRWKSGTDGGTEPQDEEFWALRDVSFDIQPGEVVGVVGRNGAGKSTLLKILSRITPPSSGRITINGRIGSLLEVGTGFHQELTGRENIYMNGSILGMSRREIERKFDAIVDFSGVERFLDTPVKRYSSGMQVRLAFAVAAHLEPEILIIDEVLAVGDAEFQKRCLGKMQDVARGGRTVLFVSHNMAAVESLCTTGVMLSGGMLVHRGTAAEIVHEYLHAVASMTGDGDLSKRNSVFERAQVLDSTGKIANTIRTGDSITIVLDLRIPKNSVSPVVGLNISTAGGVRVATAATHFDAFECPDAPGPLTLRCQIRNLALIQGLYTVRLGYDDSSGNTARVEDAAQFEVLPADRSGRGIVPASGHGCVVFDTEWNIA